MIKIMYSNLISLILLTSLSAEERYSATQGDLMYSLDLVKIRVPNGGVLVKATSCSFSEKKYSISLPQLQKSINKESRSVVHHYENGVEYTSAVRGQGTLYFFKNINMCQKLVGNVYNF